MYNRAEKGSQMISKSKSRFKASGKVVITLLCDFGKRRREEKNVKRWLAIKLSYSRIISIDGIYLLYDLWGGKVVHGH